MLTVLAVVGLVLLLGFIVFGALWWMEQGIFGFLVSLQMLELAGQILELIVKVIAEGINSQQ